MDTILIVGASSGIGLAAARHFCAHGWRVYNASRRECPLDGVIHLPTDVVNGAQLIHAVKTAAAGDGGLSALVYCAGFSMAAPLEDAAEPDYRYLFEVNFFGFLSAVKAALPFMRLQADGRIVAASSVAASLPIPFDGFYSASKAALNCMCRELNIELAPTGVRVSAVMPGGTKTGFTDRRKIGVATGPYAAAMPAAVEKLADTEQSGMNAEEVAAVIYKTVKRKNPPPVVTVGFKNKCAVALARVAPPAVTDKLIAAVFGATAK